MWTARDSMALVRRSARVHIGDVTVYVTWHVLWRTQWTLTTGMVVVTIGVKPAHLQLSDSTMGSALWGFIIYWSFSDKGQRIRQGQILPMLQLYRQRTVFLTISVLRITSLLEWTVTEFNFVQIYCSRNCNDLCYTSNACFLDDFLMHSNVEYQCSNPCKYMNGSFLFLHMQSIWTMFGTNNNSDKVSKWEYMESQRRMTTNIHD